MWKVVATGDAVIVIAGSAIVFATVRLSLKSRLTL
jgi:hypothetical protein